MMMWIQKIWCTWIPGSVRDSEYHSMNFGYGSGLIVLHSKCIELPQNIELSQNIELPQDRVATVTTQIELQLRLSDNSI